MSQMELRVQAYYTIITAGGDPAMCRAYIPFECVSTKTGEEFDYTKPEHIKRWNSGEWVTKETGEAWKQTDLHNVTTHIAFPELEIGSPEFKKKRKLGKMCNFLKNYQGGIKAIESQLGVDPSIAKVLDEAYYKAFPKIKDFQKWVNDNLVLNGRVSNLYGRTYFVREPRNYYRAGNYVIQGTCADMIKEAETRVYNLLKNTKSKLVYPIHDELCVYISKDEKPLIWEVQKIMQDVTNKMPYIPMISDIEITTTNWAEKVDIDKFDFEKEQ